MSEAHRNDVQDEIEENQRRVRPEDEVGLDENIVEGDTASDNDRGIFGIFSGDDDDEGVLGDDEDRPE